MKGKIILEEAFQLPELREEAKGYAGPNGVDLLETQLVELDNRLAMMDEAGVEFQVLSLTSPGPQGITDPEKAAALAVRGNDYIAQFVAKHPTRFSALASLAMHDPHVAAKEARRAIKELGLCGIILNDFQSAGDGNEMIFYDDPKFDPFWKEIQELDVPVYMHPRIATPLIFKQLYAKRRWLAASAWGFASQLSLHVLGIITSGVFDRFPKVQMIIGHLGEHIPADLERLDHRLDRDRFQDLPMNPHKLVRDYFTTNVHITTSGNFSTRTLISCMTELSSDRCMFSVDYPYEDSLLEGCTWMDELEISHIDKLKIARTNAIKLLKLD
ncbi:amidohydrolase family protein, partial [Atractiella rhizophila]